MEYLYLRNIYEANPFGDSHLIMLKRFINEYRAASQVDPAKCLSNTNIANLEITALPFDELDRLHYHYSHKNNGSSIEKYGLEARIGDNSTELDNKKSIYFSVGAEAVLHNWDVWLKWRLNRFFNTMAAGVRRSEELCRNRSAELWKFSSDWTKYLASKEYRKNPEILQPAFSYELIELSRSDYYVLDIRPGVDYPTTQYDHKKAVVIGSKYAEEVYGAGVSTDFSNDRAEQWNRFTEPGKDAHIEASRIKRLTAFGNDDAMSILSFLYHAYLVNCHKCGKEAADFALLPQFIAYYIGEYQS